LGRMAKEDRGDRGNVGHREPARADARDNRARILIAAEEVFGRDDEVASTEEVARRAGVGIATVFRNFPTKAELLAAVLIGRLERLRQEAVRLAATGDPRRTFHDFFAHVVADSAGKIAIARALVDAGGEVSGHVRKASDALKEAIADLLEQAQSAGAVRGDARFLDVYALLIGVSRAAAHARLDADAQRRILDIVFAGLAPSSERAG
jgi:AcrR family transcriptional regulator